MTYPGSQSKKWQREGIWEAGSCLSWFRAPLSHTCPCIVNPPERRLGSACEGDRRPASPWALRPEIRPLAVLRAGVTAATLSGTAFLQSPLQHPEADTLQCPRKLKTPMHRNPSDTQGTSPPTSGTSLGSLSGCRGQRLGHMCHEQVPCFSVPRLVSTLGREAAGGRPGSVH